MRRTVLDTVGNTPVVSLVRLNRRDDVEILAKLDYLNPGGSAKDRSLARIVDAAEESGELHPGATIIESTSGNFGVAMALAGASRGYRVICVVDPKITDVIARTLTALGAEMRMADEADETGSYLRHRLRLRDDLLDSIPGAWCPDQYSNPAGVQAHLDTGLEIVEAAEGRLDAVVIATGTGATVTGIGRVIRDEIPGCRVIAVDAYGSQIFDDQVHRWLQKGLGSGLSAEQLDNLDVDVIDEARLVGDRNAFLAARMLARHEGLMAGGSAGAAVFAALTIAEEAPPGARIMTLLSDGLERYLFEYASDEWMERHGFDTSTERRVLWDAVERWLETHETIALGPAGVPVLKAPQELGRPGIT